MRTRGQIVRIFSQATKVASHALIEIAQKTVAVATSKPAIWTVKTAGKAFIVGLATATGMSFGGPVGGAVLATLAGSAVGSGATGSTGSSGAA